MNENKRTVAMYKECYSRTDHGEMLSCLTNDVEWVLPGAFHLRGREEFKK